MTKEELEASFSHPVEIEAAQRRIYSAKEYWYAVLFSLSLIGAKFFDLVEPSWTMIFILVVMIIYIGELMTSVEGRLNPRQLERELNRREELYKIKLSQMDGIQKDIEKLSDRTHLLHAKINEYILKQEYKDAIRRETEKEEIHYDKIFSIVLNYMRSKDELGDESFPSLGKRNPRIEKLLKKDKKYIDYSDEFIFIGYDNGVMFFTQRSYLDEDLCWMVHRSFRDIVPPSIQIENSTDNILDKE